jgi:hypothetical protein
MASHRGTEARRKKAPAPAPEDPTWAQRVIWGAYGLLAGFAAGALASLALLSFTGPYVAQFIFRVLAYGFLFSGLDYAGQRQHWKRSLLRGFGLGTAIALLRAALVFL